MRQPASRATPAPRTSPASRGPAASPSAPVASGPPLPPWTAWLRAPRALEAQLAMLEALARSQGAVARLLESAADAAAAQAIPAALIRAELRALANAQSAMLGALTGLAPPRLKRGGPPPPPWLHPEARRGR